MNGIKLNITPVGPPPPTLHFLLAAHHLFIPSPNSSSSPSVSTHYYFPDTHRHKHHFPTKFVSNKHKTVFESMELELESSTTPSAPDTPSNATRSFCFPCFAPRRRSTWWERVRSASWSRSHSRPTTSGDRWWSRGLRALKKLREWSEIVAGPRWKTFIRRFNRNRACKRVAAKYQYDPLSYALNFDEGQNGDFNNDSPRNFSTRYASVSRSTEVGSNDTVLV